MKRLEDLKVVITFKPLSGNRFRCNQTGVVTKDPKGYRYKKFKEGESKIPLKGKNNPVPKRQEKKVHMRSWW